MSAHERKGEVSEVEVKFTRRGSKLTFLENLSPLLHQFQQAGKRSVLVILGCPREDPGCAELPSPLMLCNAQASSHAVG